MSSFLDVYLFCGLLKTREMQLTKAEEQIMQILWTMKEGTVQDILKGFTAEVPARTTVATILKILEDKDFVTHRSEGRSNVYRTLISKEKYSKKQMASFVKNYFNGSFSSMISFFAKESDISLEEMDRIIEDTKEELKQEKLNRK